jgi:hypothetical protein
MEVWEGEGPGGVWVLLANPRWERQFVKFLELLGVGRMMADGTDEDDACAAKMTSAWYGRRWRGRPRGANLLPFHLLSLVSFL